jgi:hypothetical protein
MDHQGAGFAFDSNMDFTNMFAATPDATLFKPAGNTSGFFFADEGIDTATSSFIDPTTTSGTPQLGGYDMTIQSTASYFPQTPATQFLDTTQFNAFGKRSLQLDADDFPQSKRQASYDFPLFPTPPQTNTTTSSWGLEPTPSVSTTLEGLSDEAADVCATWFTKYNVLPG